MVISGMGIPGERSRSVDRRPDVVWWLLSARHRALAAMKSRAPLCAPIVVSLGLLMTQATDTASSECCGASAWSLGSKPAWANASPGAPLRMVFSQPCAIAYIKASDRISHLLDEPLHLLRAMQLSAVDNVRLACWRRSLWHARTLPNRLNASTSRSTAS
jgi:hypothetical protein